MHRLPTSLSIGALFASIALSQAAFAQEPSRAPGEPAQPVQAVPSTVPPMPTAAPPNPAAVDPVQVAVPPGLKVPPAVPTPNLAEPVAPAATVPAATASSAPPAETGTAAAQHEPAAHAPTAPPADVATSPLPPFDTPEAGAHGAAEHHGNAHEGHDAPVIENWWSWDYGPGKTHHHPPFGFALINFFVFVLILAKLFGKSFQDFLRTRHTEVRHALDKAREAQQHAEKHLQQIEARTRNLESEIAEILSSYRRLAESERQAIVQRAEAEAASLLKDADAQAQAAIATAKRTLEQRTALMAVDIAEKLLREHLREDDFRRLNDRYIGELEAIAQKSAAHTSAGTGPTTGLGTSAPGRKEFP